MRASADGKLKCWDRGVESDSDWPLNNVRGVMWLQRAAHLTHVLLRSHYFRWILLLRLQPKSYVFARFGSQAHRCAVFVTAKLLLLV
jgi:hypothetical protein